MTVWSKMIGFFSSLALAFNFHRISSNQLMSCSLEGLGEQGTVRCVLMLGDLFCSVVNSLRPQHFLKNLFLNHLHTCIPVLNCIVPTMLHCLPGYHFTAAHRLLPYHLKPEACFISEPNSWSSLCSLLGSWIVSCQPFYLKALNISWLANWEIETVFNELGKAHWNCLRR